MVWIVRDHNDHLVPSLSATGRLDQVAQSPTQSGFEHFQAWGIQNFLGYSNPNTQHMSILFKKST